jgi:spermidine synthase
VDIDSEIVELGKKYLGLDKIPVDIKIQDAFKFVQTTNDERPFGKAQGKPKTKYNLICVDLYVGDEFPERFESDAFLRLIHRMLSVHGIAVFNRLYYGEKRKTALAFGKKLEKIFKTVDYVYPEANLMLLGS